MKTFSFAMLFLFSGFRASALSLARSQDRHGALIHIKFGRESVAVFGFELVEIKTDIEIASADEWKPIELDLCEKEYEPECSHIQVSNSATHPEKMRQGVRMSKHYFSSTLPKLLQQVHVDIFHAVTGICPFVTPVYEAGPVARLELRGGTGEMRLVSSTLMTFLASGNTVLGLTADYTCSDPDFADFRRGIEQALLKTPGKSPLLFHFGGGDVEYKRTSLFPESCVLVSSDYWGKHFEIIHATPDAVRRGQNDNMVPIMTAKCYADHAANSPSETNYIFVYGKRKEISNELLVGLHRELMLPVVVLSKEGTCTEDLKHVGVTCVEQVQEVAQFHKILRGARILISECVNDDNPTMLEAVGCGTPVITQAGRHKMLDAYGERPHVFTWQNTSELFHAAREAIEATSMGDHKLAAWTPAPLREDVMRRSVEELLHTTRQNCDLDLLGQ